MENNQLSPQEREWNAQLDRWEKELDSSNTPIEKSPSKYLNREEVLRQIEYNISDLSDEDAEGHIWWNKFKELVNQL